MKRPFDDKGRFVPLRCENCGCGELRDQGDGSWQCDGLADPGHPDKELEACTHTHYDGEPARATGVLA